MITVIIDQIVKLFEKGKAKTSKAYDDEQSLKEDKKLPKTPVIIANKSALLNNLSVNSSSQDNTPGITQSVTTGVTFWVKSDNHIKTNNKAKFTTILRKGTLLKIGARGRGRSP
ncbi:hypothetical protein NOVO_01565 [Rickettsiales bacterium Ac37b]|nr:hypothetical protein NOVO_01565 [Rickettsiales bacterium Ac37b]